MFENVIKIWHYVNSSRKKQIIIQPRTLNKTLPANIQNSSMITALILFFCNLQTLYNDHVIFKEIGEMTGAISYIHLILHVDIPGLKEQADHYIQQVWDLRKATIDLKLQWKGNENYKL
jgi:hypothetical protein